MSKREELYGIWYNIQDRWAHLIPPSNLRIKYNHSGFALNPLFAPRPVIQKWFDDKLLDHDFSIKSFDEGQLRLMSLRQERLHIERERCSKEADQRRRQLHADKYL